MIFFFTKWKLAKNKTKQSVMKNGAITNRCKITIGNRSTLVDKGNIHRRLDEIDRSIGQQFII